MDQDFVENLSARQKSFLMDWDAIETKSKKLDGSNMQ